MAEYIDREKIREETCKGCVHRTGKDGCGWPEPCEKLIGAFLNAEPSDITYAIDPESLPIVQELRAELARVTAERDKIAQYELDACDEYCFGDSSTGIHECEWLDSNDRCKLKEWAEGRGTKGD